MKRKNLSEMNFKTLVSNKEPIEPISTSRKFSIGDSKTLSPKNFRRIAKVHFM